MPRVPVPRVSLMPCQASQGWIYSPFLVLPVAAEFFLLIVMTVTCSVAAVVFSGRPPNGLPSLGGIRPHTTGFIAIDRWT
jgi:hypothetical protein